MAKTATDQRVKYSPDCVKYSPVNQAYSRSGAVLGWLFRLAEATNRQLGKDAKAGRWHWTIFL